jgi:hypothetical protein
MHMLDRASSIKPLDAVVYGIRARRPQDLTANGPDGTYRALPALFVGHQTLEPQTSVLYFPCFEWV